MNKYLEQLNQIDDLGGPDIRGFQRDGRRFKGGGGGDPAAYQRELEAKKEAQRQAYYAGTGWNDPTNQAAREKQYGQMEQDLTNFHRQQLDKERGTASQQMGFNMARAGQSGGSQQAYDQSMMDETYQKGLADIAAKAKSAVAQAKSGGESAFSRGLQAINSGGDATTQISSTMNDIANSMANALESAKGGSWGGFFGNLASTTDTAKANAGAGAAVKGAYGMGDSAESSLANVSTKGGQRTYQTK